MTPVLYLQEPLLCGDEHHTEKTLERSNQLYNLLESKGRDVIHLGDIFHTKEKLSSKALNLLFKRLSESKLNHLLIVGNHDWHSLECTEHSLEIFKSLDNLTIVDKPTLIQVNGVNATVMPYYHDLAQFAYDLTKTASWGSKLLFLHQGLTGFDYGNGFIAEHDLDINTLKGYEKVYLGHFHKYQQKKNSTFLGTPYSNDFGESNQTKYLGILRKDLSLDLIETDFPRHMTLTVNASEQKQLPFNSQVTYDYYRVILTGIKEDIESFPKENYPGVKFIERPDSTFSSIEFTEKLSNEAKFQSWAKDRIDVETQKLGMEILSGVK